MNERIKVGDVYFELAKDAPARSAQIIAEKTDVPARLDAVAFAPIEPDLVAQYIERKIPVAEEAPEADEDRYLEWQAFAGSRSAIPQQWRDYAEGKRRHCGFNIWAFVFGLQWFLFNRMYGKAIVVGLVEVSLALVAGILIADFHRPVFVFAVLTIFLSLPRAAAACWANLALYRKANREIEHARSLKLDTQRKLAVIAHAGSPGFAAIVFFYVIVFAVKIMMT